MALLALGLLASDVVEVGSGPLSLPTSHTP